MKDLTSSISLTQVWNSTNTCCTNMALELTANSWRIVGAIDNRMFLLFQPTMVIVSREQSCEAKKLLIVVKTLRQSMDAEVDQYLTLTMHITCICIFKTTLSCCSIESFITFFLRVLVSVTKILVSEKRSPCCSRGGCWDPSELETPSILCSFSTQSRSPDPECWKLRTLGREIIQNPKSSKYKICGNSFYLSPLKLLSEGVIWEIPGEVDLICRQRESRKKKNISTHHPVSSINAMVILL